MVNRILVLAVCVTAIVTLNARSATSQQPKPLPANPVIANPVIANPVDPASLNAPPAFGDSAPVERKPVKAVTQELAPQETAPLMETEWKPKLRVVLLTKAGSLDAPVPFQRNEKSQNFFSDDSDDFVPPPNDVKRTTNRMTAPKQSFAILMCDEVNVDAKASEAGELVYSFSCKGKVILNIDDYTVTGDSISSPEGKLTITNAVVKSDKATLTAEKMQIQLPILGVRVEPDSPDPIGSSGSLGPVPDAIDPPAFPPSARLETY